MPDTTPTPSECKPGETLIDGKCVPDITPPPPNDFTVAPQEEEEEENED